MIVFQMRHVEPDCTRLGIFVSEPFNFSGEYKRAFWSDVYGIRVPVLCYDALIDLKRRSGRPRDLGDIDQLQLSKSAD